MKRCLFGQDRPNDPGHFVGQCTGHDVRMSASQHLFDPDSERVVSLVDPLHDRSGPLYEEASEMFVSSLKPSVFDDWIYGQVLSKALSCCRHRSDIA